MNEQEIIQLLSDIKHRIFPRSFERLAVEGIDLVGVEIGVYKGAHAESLLQHLDIKMLYLVDPYEEYDDYINAKSFYSDLESLKRSRDEAKKRLEKYKDKITWIHTKSLDSIVRIPNDLDFVYIDGNHEKSFVKNDIHAFWPKIKANGIIGGHDFYNGFARDHDGVVSAVTEFSVSNNLVLQAELPDWWIQKTDSFLK